MDPRTIPLPDLAATEALGAALAPLLRPGDCILLEGPLGAGKSALVRALLRAASGNPTLDVPSPSFTLVQTYRTPTLILHHLDLWRLDGPAALDELGWDDMLQNVVLVEWPDRLGNRAPADALRIALSYALDGCERQASIREDSSFLKKRSKRLLDVGARVASGADRNM